MNGTGAREGLSEWMLWQIADSAFPAGSFAHSGGLESAWRMGEVRGGEGLESFCEASLRQAGRSMLPLALAAWRAPEDAEELDAFCDVWLSNHVANRASRLQGRAFSMALAKTFGWPERPWPRWHWAPVYGAGLAWLGASEWQAARLFLFLHTRGLVSAAVRLGIVGPLEAQRVQTRLARVAEDTARSGASATLEDLAQTSPLLDLWQATHDELETRLFQS